MSTATGRTTMTVQRLADYDLSVFSGGPIAKELILTPGASQDLDLALGAFRIAGRDAAAASAFPLYGNDDYVASTNYSLAFCLGRQSRGSG
ncbi:MAG: hypothetical protein ABSC23_17240 [Bryobacteraceae bacterium]